MKTRRQPILRHIAVATLLISVSLGCVNPAQAITQRTLIAGYAEQARKENHGFKGFSAERGRSLYSSNHSTGKPDTPSCTSCHTHNPMNAGVTRAGKEILPLAASRTPERYTDARKVEKWFRRNCNSVLGRTCTPMEKGDFLTFMINQ